MLKRNLQSCLVSNDKVDVTNAQKSVSAEDMKRFEREAKELVAKASQLRKQGEFVTYDDFSREENARMRVYNVTMRVNRLEYLKAQMGLFLVDLGSDVGHELAEKLTDDYISEVKRQAGILGENLSSLWTGKEVAKIIMAQTGSATFSQRLWANLDALKAELDGVIASGIIQGDNPQEMARKLKSQLKDTVKNHKYVTERLARTESARVQFSAQTQSLKEAGYKYCMWHDEPKACSTCQTIAQHKSDYGVGIYELEKVPSIPVHPNCRCSISAYWVDEEAISEKNHKTTKADKLNICNDQLRKAFEDMFGHKDAQKIITDINEQISKAPKNVRRMFEKHSSKFRVAFTKQSYFSPRRDMVSLTKTGLNLENDKNYYQKKYDVFFHEFGHFIDHHGLGIKFYDLPSQDLSYYLDEDIDQLIKERIDKVELTKEGMLGTGYTRINGINYKLKKNGDLTKAAENKLRTYKRKQALKMLVTEVQDKCQNKQSYSDFSDIIGGAKILDTTFPLGVGHSESYWNQTTRSVEFFAEATSATINNPESLEILKTHFPKTYAQYEKIVEEIAEYDD